MQAPLKDSKQYRRALGSFTTGVTIVTTRDPAGNDIGLTANSFSSVSLDPPMVLWSMARKSQSLASFLASGHFAVHVLASTQDDLSDRFASRSPDRFAGLALDRGIGQVPLLAGCTAQFQCRTVYQYEGGDHVIFVGEVVSFEHTERPPLVFHGGRYAIAASKIDARPAAEAAPEDDHRFSREFLIYLLGRAHYQQFLLMRRALEQHGLGEMDWFVLSVLGSAGDRTLAEVDEELAYTGTTVTYDQVASLAVAGLVELHGAYDPGVALSITNKGRRAVVELIAAAKAAEADIEQSLGHEEIRMLKQWLRAIVDSSNPGPPALWRRPSD